jgi:formate hydrogenlyase transcriptional activator
MMNSSDIHNAKILIVDDQEANVKLLDSVLRKAGYASITAATDPHTVCELHRRNRYDLILLDLVMPGMDGFQVMEDLKEIDREGYLPVLVITAQPDQKLRALQAGAKDFVSKPFDLAEVQARVYNILEVSLLQKKLHHYNDELELRVKERSGELIASNEQLSQEIEERKGAEESLRSTYAEIKQLKDRFHAENIYLNQAIDREYNFGEIIGRSNALRHVFFRVEQVAPQDTTVLLLGETGTGKGAVARAIHSRSSPVRQEMPMITVNCSALPANLIESELFGREKGAFTGSSERQMGRFELADKGTLFLDEIGEMPIELQTKLLRVIQDGEFERLGGPKTIKVNVRIIASTNRNLEEAIRNNTFREDLFYRLNVFPITIPPLRQRKEDIPLLVDFFVAKFNKKIGKKIETVPKETLDMLQAYHWPGNVRELESIIERAVITSQGNALQVLDRLETSRKTEDQAAEQAPHDAKGLSELQRDRILQVLQQTNWRIEGKNGAAAVLGLNPSTLRGRMRKEGIRRS